MQWAVALLLLDQLHGLLAMIASGAADAHLTRCLHDVQQQRVCESCPVREHLASSVSCAC
jgi:hypothetical protein